MTRNLITLTLLLSLGACDLLEDDDDTTEETPVNTAATFSGDATGSLSTDASAAITGTITVTDPDTDEAAVTAQTDAATTYGSFSIAADGSWSYTLDANNTDVAALSSSTETLTDTVTFSSVDGTESSVAITISGVDPVNTAATFAGDLTGSVANNATAAIMGTITVTDPDSGEAAVQAETDSVLTYGTFSIDANGAWSYTLDTANSTIAALADSSDTLMETISVDSVDGTSTDLVITISGVDVVVAPATVTDDFDSYTADTQIDAANSAYVVNSADGTTNVANVSTTFADSGTSSLYLLDNDGDGSTGTKPVVSRAFSNGAADSGSVSVSVYIPTDGYNKSTYLYLGSSESGSSSNRFTEVVFGSSEVKFRNESGSQKALHDYAKDTWVDVTIAWAGTAITVTVDDMVYTTYDNDGTPADLVAENDDSAGPTLFAMYVGDSKTAGTYSYFDNLDSDLFDAAAAATITDDFDAYTADTQVDAANSAYNVDSADGTTNIANISTTQADSGSNSLYLLDNDGDGSTGTKPVVSRTFAGGAADSGSVSVSVYIPTDGYNKSTYLYLGSSASGSSSNRFTEVVFGSSEVKFRNESGSQKALHDYAKDTWVDVTIAWTGTAVTVTVDDMVYTTYDNDGTPADLVAENDDSAGPTLFALYVGDSKTSGTYSYFDNLDSDLF